MDNVQLLYQLKKVYGASLGAPSKDVLSKLFLNPDNAHIQDELITELLLAPHFQKFPPSRESRRLFWKSVVEYLEEVGEEVDERVYGAYLDLVSTRTSSFPTRPPSPSYNTHIWSLHPNIQEIHNVLLTTLLESRTVIEGGTTGLRTWSASITFANWLVEHPDIVQGRKVLELGSGAGFLGLIVAALQLDPQAPMHSRAFGLVLSDVDSTVLSRCRKNVYLPCNGMENHPSLEFRLLDWSDALDSSARLDPDSAFNSVLKDVDTIIGADLVYDTTIIPALTAMLAAFFHLKHGESPLQNRNPRAYIAMTVRREQTVSTFISSLSSHALAYEDIDATDVSQNHFLGGMEDGANAGVKLVKIFPRPAQN